MLFRSFPFLVFDARTNGSSPSFPIHFLSLSLSLFYHRYIVGAYKSARLWIASRRGFINISRKKVLHQFALYYGISLLPGRYNTRLEVRIMRTGHIYFGHYSPLSSVAGIRRNDCLYCVRGECTASVMYDIIHTYVHCARTTEIRKNGSDVRDVKNNFQRADDSFIVLFIHFICRF